MNPFEQIIRQFQDCTDNLKTLLESFSDEGFMQKPAPEKWSAAEITEHLYISDRSAWYAMAKNPRPADRNPLEKAGMLEERRQQPEARYEAPDPARPKGAFGSRREAIDAWYANRKKILSLAETENPEMLGGGFEHPKLGWMTRAEWLLFITWHTGHHIQQFEALPRA